MNKQHIFVFGCTKTKLDNRSKLGTRPRILPADLYGKSQLFRARLAYMERLAQQTGNPPTWCVISAKYGHVASDRQIQWYEETMRDMDAADRAEWALTTANHLISYCTEAWHADETSPRGKPTDLTFEIHAGSDYTRLLVPILRSVGANVVLPVAGLGIGQQLRWYSDKHAAVAA